MYDTVIAGRTITSFNSFFIAIIRYIYIVHDVKANQWHFEKVGRGFQVASVIVPLVLATLIIFMFDPLLVLDQEETFKQCPNVYNATVHESEVLKSFRMQLSNRYLPEKIVNFIGILSVAITVLVFLNAIEAILYVQIFRKMRR